MIFNFEDRAQTSKEVIQIVCQDKKNDNEVR